MGLRRLVYLVTHSSFARRVGIAELLPRIKSYVRIASAKRMRARKVLACRLHGKLSEEDILAHVRYLGIAAGDTVFVQISLNDLLTYKGKATGLLSCLLDAVGPSGTLLMPAFSIPPDSRSDTVIDLAREPTYTGLVNEIFRRKVGVIRSLHPRQSMCGLGPDAERILASHELCARAHGANSPFDRLRSRTNAKILTIGLPPGYISFLHWVEDIEPERFPLAVHEPEAVTRRMLLPNGNIQLVSDYEVRADVASRLNLKRVAKSLSKSSMRFGTFKGVRFGVYSIPELARELLALRDAGIVHYR